VIFSPGDVEIGPGRTSSRRAGNPAGRPRPGAIVKYMLMIYTNEAAMQQVRQQDMQQLMGAYFAYTEALKEAGVYLAGDPLQRSNTATTVRIADGKTQVLHGPYAETREQLGGYYLIDAPDLDAALSWASRCPGASHGVIEVRPIRTL
jgi:hypothetical protein